MQPHKTPNEVIQLVSEHYRIKQEEIKGPRQAKHIVQARHMSAFLMHRLGYSFPTIGHALNRSHSAMIFANFKIEQAILNKTELGMTAFHLLTVLKGVPDEQ